MGTAQRDMSRRKTSSILFFIIFFKKMKNRNMKDLLKQFYVIGFRFKIGFHFIRVWASIFSLTFNSMMKGVSSLKRIKGLAGTWRLTLDKTGRN